METRWFLKKILNSINTFQYQISHTFFIIYHGPASLNKLNVTSTGFYKVKTILFYCRTVHGIQLCELGRDYLPLFHLRLTLLQAVIQGSACCAHWTGQTCADKIQLEVRSVQALPEYFSSSSLHPKVGMLRALNRLDMRRQDSARSVQCPCSTWIFLFFKHSFKGPHAAYTEPVRHAQTRFS